MCLCVCMWACMYVYCVFTRLHLLSFSGGHTAYCVYTCLHLLSFSGGSWCAEQACVWARCTRCVHRPKLSGLCVDSRVWTQTCSCTMAMSSASTKTVIIISIIIITCIIIIIISIISSSSSSSSSSSIIIKEAFQAATSTRVSWLAPVSPVLQTAAKINTGFVASPRYGFQCQWSGCLQSAVRISPCSLRPNAIEFLRQFVLLFSFLSITPSCWSGVEVG